MTRNGTIWETDLIPHELHRLFGDDQFVWGGDLNSAQRMDDKPRFAGGNRALRTRWHASGFVDIRSRFFADEQQTYFNPKSDPYQLDHVFADALTEARVTNWRVDIDPVIAEPRCSDHAMIRVDLGESR